MNCVLPVYPGTVAILKLTDIKHRLTAINNCTFLRDSFEYDNSSRPHAKV